MRTFYKDDRAKEALTQRLYSAERALETISAYKARVIYDLENPATHGCFIEFSRMRLRSQWGSYDLCRVNGEWYAKRSVPGGEFNAVGLADREYPLDESFDQMDERNQLGWLHGRDEIVEWTKLNRKWDRREINNILTVNDFYEWPGHSTLSQFEHWIEYSYSQWQKHAETR